GVGVLFVRHGTNILAQQQGGSQERYRRAGTENVAAAVGMAAALGLSVAERPQTVARLRELRDSLASSVGAIEGVQQTGHPTERLPGLASFVVGGVEGSAVTMALDLAGLACSTGSACVSGSNEVSHVLSAMGYPADEARGALRLSLGRTTTAEEVAMAADLLTRTIDSQREVAEKLAAGRVAAQARPMQLPAQEEAGAQVPVE
ncbi:MAG TPA: aminotransferase class V-fold PLP-dependent enzyme, partial [Candidatus Limnocylindrales bacterium]